MHIAALAATEAQQYRDLMLEAYTQVPDAFTSTAEERSVEPLSWWIKRIADPLGFSQSFGAFQGDELVGTVTLEFSSKPKTRHSAQIIGMYVRLGARRQGVGARLLEEAIAAASARPGLQTLRLTVTEGNEPAIRLYASAGFLAWGVEPLAIHTSSGYRGKVLMLMQLRAVAPAA